MQTLTIEGLADDRLSSRVIEALQSVVFLLPVATKWTIVNDAPHVESEEMWYWYDENGVAQAMTPDLLWHQWRDGAIPSTIGVHEVNVTAPGWTQRVGGQPSVPVEMKFTAHVYGVVITVSGRGSDHVLIDAMKQQAKKRQVHIEFDPPTNVPLRAFESEEDFAKFVNEKPEALKVIHRVRLPRIQWQGLFWPVSNRVRRELAELEKVKSRDDITPEDFVALEQRSLASVWDEFPVPPKPAT